jgi:hypothetical protein
MGSFRSKRDRSYASLVCPRLFYSNTIRSGHDQEREGKAREKWRGVRTSELMLLSFNSARARLRA